MNNDYEYLPEIDLIFERGMRESKSLRQFWTDGGKKINVSELTNPPEFLKKLIPEWAEYAKKLEQPQWYVKFASSIFKYKDTWYCICPQDIHCSEEVFEKVSSQIAKDLLALGIEHIHYTGMLD
jgi:hypothetical protein